MFSNTWVDELVSKHANSGVLVDSNLLLVFLVWLHEPQLVSQTRGTREYTVGDAELIGATLARFSKIHVTPNTMTELSNLVQRVGQRTSQLYETLQRRIVELADESYEPTAQAVHSHCYHRLGLTDAVLSQLAARDFLVFTNDLDLSIYLESNGLPCIHYDRELRPFTLED